MQKKYSVKESLLFFSNKLQRPYFFVFTYTHTTKCGHLWTVHACGVKICVKNSKASKQKINKQTNENERISHTTHTPFTPFPCCRKTKKNTQGEKEREREKKSALFGIVSFIFVPKIIDNSRRGRDQMCNAQTMECNCNSNPSQERFPLH